MKSIAGERLSGVTEGKPRKKKSGGVERGKECRGEFLTYPTRNATSSAMNFCASRGRRATKAGVSTGVGQKKRGEEVKPIAEEKKRVRCRREVVGVEIRNDDYFERAV